MSELHGKPAEAIGVESLVEAFDEAVDHHPEYPALIKPDGSVISFLELQGRSNDIANKILNICGDRMKGSRGESKHAILAMSPTTDRIICILALWKLNMAYVPVEACVPKNRIKLMIREVKPVFVLTGEDLAERFVHHDVYAEGLNVVIRLEDILDEPSVDQKLDTIHDRRSTACVLYTSGSTGEPKGVLLTHQNILSRLHWQWNEFPFQADDVGIAKTSLLFVDSISEIWCFLLKGKPIVVLETGQRDIETLVKVCIERDITRIVVVPSLLQGLLYYIKMTKNVDKLSSLREIICSGERLPKSLAEEFFRIFPTKVLMNFYGSTEVTGDASFVRFLNMEDVNSYNLNGMLSIGKPIDGVTIRVLDETGHLVSEGEIGQLVVSGPTVTPGYVGTSYYGTILDGRYETGDYGRIYNGHLIFEGRYDDQVKIRGNRINVEEVQRKLKEELGVDVVVLVMKPDTPDAQLVAFVVGDEETETKATVIYEASFPAYMIPSVVSVDHIPLTDSTQKIDRQLLKQMYEDSRNSETDDLLSGSAQIFLSILCEELGIPERAASLNKQFYSLGGNSINKVRIAASLQDKGFHLDTAEFLRAGTLREMLQCCENTTEEQKMVKDHKFTIRQADGKSPRDEILKLVNENLSSKDPFLIACRLTLFEIDFVSRLLYDMGLSDNGLFYIEDNNGRVVAVIVLINCTEMETVMQRLQEIMSPSIALTFEVLGEFDEALEKCVPQGEPVLEFLSWATSPLMTAEENLELTELAEKFVLDVGRERGFYAVQATNTNPVTRALATNHGYETIYSLHLKDYTRPDGTKPFTHAPPDTIFSAQIKFLRGHD